MILSLSLMLMLFLLVVLCVSDIKSREIHHFPLIILFVISISLMIGNDYFSIFISLLILAAGFVLFCFKIIGAGDVKLLAILSLAITPSLMPVTLALILMLGGLQSLIIITYHYIRHGSYPRGYAVPYAIPISIGGYIGVLASY